jgi:hypothetical protein
MAHGDDGITHNGSAYTVPRDDAPPKPLTPEAEGAARVLEIIMHLRANRWPSMSGAGVDAG